MRCTYVWGCTVRRIWITSVALNFTNPYLGRGGVAWYDHLRYINIYPLWPSLGTIELKEVLPGRVTRDPNARQPSPCSRDQIQIDAAAARSSRLCKVHLILQHVMYAIQPHVFPPHGQPSLMRTGLPTWPTLRESLVNIGLEFSFPARTVLYSNVCNLEAVFEVFSVFLALVYASTIEACELLRSTWCNHYGPRVPVQILGWSVRVYHLRICAWRWTIWSSPPITLFMIVSSSQDQCVCRRWPSSVEPRTWSKPISGEYAILRSCYNVLIQRFDIFPPVQKRSGKRTRWSSVK